MDIFLALQVISAVFLCGLIWVIQLLHYPSFNYIEESKFAEFESFHTRKIAYLVMPAMLIELSTAIYFCSQFNDDWLWWINLFAIVSIWLSTAFLSVPCHKLLARGKDRKVIDFLVVSNWPRTLIWSAKLVLLWMIINRDY